MLNISFKCPFNIIDVAAEWCCFLQQSFHEGECFKILYHTVEKKSERKKDSKVSDAYFCMFPRAPQ